MYYVYALLDPRKPGKFRYSLGTGKWATFDHEPFYIGKGKGNRISAHVPTALLGVEQTFKARRIRRIHAHGLAVIEKKCKQLFDEPTAFEYEKLLIASIGRYDLRRGPLCNLTDGGDGAPNLSPKVRARMSKSSRAWWKSLTAAERILKVEQYNDWWNQLGEDGRAAFAQQKRKDTNAYISKMSDAEYFSYVQNHRRRIQNWWKSLTPDEMERYRDTQSRVQSARWAAVPKDARKAHGAKTVATRAQMSDGRKQLYTQRKRVSAKSWYSSLTPEQRAEMKLKQDAAKQNYPLRTCPHCGTQGKGGNMTRYHFDGCKQRP